MVHSIISSDDSWVVPPVPIPNTVVKHSYAESTCLETGWEDSALLVKQKEFVYTDSFFVLSNGFIKLAIISTYQQKICAFCLLTVYI